MTKYQITQTVSGVVLGTYDGETPEQALDAMAQDQSYKDYDDLLSVTGETRDTATLEVDAVQYLCTTCKSAISSASHCSNIPRAALPFGLLTLDSSPDQIKATAIVLAGCVRSTLAAFPAENRAPAGYKRALCVSAAATAISDDDYEDVSLDLIEAIFFAV